MSEIGVGDYTPSRAQEGSLAFLATRQGWLQQADAYSGYSSLFEGEAALRGRGGGEILPEVWAKVRQEESRPVLEELFEWLEARRDRDLLQSPLGNAIGYALN